MSIDMKKIILSEKFKLTLRIVGGLCIALFIFQAGMFVGFKKASFYNRVGERYFREIHGNKNDFMMGMRRSDFSNSYGAVGKIIQVHLPIIIVEDRDGIDKTVTIASTTILRSGMATILPSDLKIDDYVTVFGADTDDSLINASLIRILPHESTTTMMNGNK